MRRLVVGITGATGTLYAIRLLHALRAAGGIEIHLVMSTPARRTLVEETDLTAADVEALADVVHDNRDIGSPLASGTFRTDGMAVVPASIKTVSSLAHCYSSTLVARAADVCLKERRPLVVVVREAPLHVGHLRLLVQLAEMGAVILPPMPALYARPRTVEDVIDHTVGRILDHLAVPHALAPEWRPRAGRAAVRETE